MKYLLFFISFLSFAQQIKSVDFKEANGQLLLDGVEKKVSGTVSYTFDVLQPLDTIKIDARKMHFSIVTLDDLKVDFQTTDQQLLVIFPFSSGPHRLQLHYEAYPKQALYFIGEAGTETFQIWSQGQGRYTSNWFPSFDDVNEKIIFKLAVTYASDYEVYSNGLLKSITTQSGSTTWKYEMQQPMSSYLLALAVGKYNLNKGKSKSGIPLEMCIETKDATRFEPTYRNSTELFNFLEKEIGVPYPWQTYRQVPVRDFLYAGMENTSCTLFSSTYVVDEVGYEDRKYSNVNAHELAHQWFGDLVTAADGRHHWLQEGFATYFALLAEKKLYGEDYFYFKLHQTAQQLKYASRTDTIPVLHPKASSLTFYEKGAWSLFVLHQSIGDKAFKKAIKNYLNKFAFQSVTTDDFFAEIKKVSHFDTAAFSKVWLESTLFNTQQANDLLLKNKNIQLLFEVESYKQKPLSEKQLFFEKVLSSNCYFKVKEAILNQLKTEKFEAKKTLLRLALGSQNLQVRQVVAATLAAIPSDFKLDFETLLNDASYQTQEIALYRLWANFPNERQKYLDISKSWIGFNDYNLRTLWLSLALSTESYLSALEAKDAIYELIHYASPTFEAVTRQNAMEQLLNFNLLSEQVLVHLVNATTHHMWQFSKFGRDSIRKLLKNSDVRLAFKQLLPNLTPAEQYQLQRLLSE